MGELSFDLLVCTADIVLQHSELHEQGVVFEECIPDGAFRPRNPDFGHFGSRGDNACSAS
jgi:hypothetical protein